MRDRWCSSEFRAAMGVHGTEASGTSDTRDEDGVLSVNIARAYMHVQ